MGRCKFFSQYVLWKAAWGGYLGPRGWGLFPPGLEEPPQAPTLSLSAGTSAGSMMRWRQNVGTHCNLVKKKKGNKTPSLQLIKKAPKSIETSLLILKEVSEFMSIHAAALHSPFCLFSDV